jgi:hypothetical protein
MNKKCLFIVLSMCIFFRTWPENTKIKRDSEFLRMNTPNVSSFDKYFDNPISLYNGTPNINIPVYTLQDGQIRLPISLRYNSSGIKVEEDASWVGLGWNLDVGGMISQNVVGDDDDNNGGSYGDVYNFHLWLKAHKDNSEWLTGQHASMTNTRELYALLLGYRKGNKSLFRLNPDVYYFTYPGGSGKFFIDFENNIHILNREQGQGIKIEVTASSATTNPSIESFKITTAEGVTHLFNYASSMREGSGLGAQSRYYTLDKTSYPNGQDISYFYTKHAASKPHYSQNLQIITAVSNVVFSTSPYNVTTEAQTASPSQYLSTNHGEECILDSIVTTNYKVEFSTGSRTDIENGVKLNQIKISPLSSLSNGIKKEYNFEYGYFVSATDGNFWKSSLDSYDINRLRLDKFYEKDQGKYEFAYNGLPLPAKGSFAIDYWGYYNGKTKNKSLIPDFRSLFYPEGSEFEMEMIPPAYQTVLLKANARYRADRESSGDSTKACILEGIKYPTGGYTRFEYENNTFAAKRLIGSQNGDALSGCGLRIKRITSYDSPAMEKVEACKAYEYSEGVLHDNAVFYDSKHLAWNFAANDLLYCGLTPLALLSCDIDYYDLYGSSVYSNPYGSGKGVGYGSVKETSTGETLKNGYVKYKFHNERGIYYPNSYCVENEPLNGKLIRREAYLEGVSSPVETEQNYYKAYVRYSGTGVNVLDAYQNSNTVFSDFYCGLSGWNHSDTQEGYVDDRMRVCLFNLYACDILLDSCITRKDGVQNVDKFTYDMTTLQLKEKSTRLPLNGSFTYSHTYPSDYDCGIFTDMVNKNLLSPVVEEKIFRNGRYIGGNLTEYGYDGSNRMIVPQKKYFSEVKDYGDMPQTYACGGGIDTRMYPFQSIAYDRYDYFGNINQMTVDSSSIVFYLWSYNGQYPIAEIKDATYEQIKSALNFTSDTQMNELSAMAAPDVNSIRTKLDSYFKNSVAQVTTYTYRPLVGMTSATAPNGVTTYYEYDTFNRLKRTYIKENNVEKTVQTYDYHYKQ